MPFDITPLQKLDLSPTAAKVYLVLLELGKATADRIAKRAGTYKANVYDALERLQEAGLSTYLHEENKKFYLPTNPAKLPQIIEEFEKRQQEKTEALRKDIQQLMPQLTAKYESVKEKELFEVYRGRKAYKALISEILKEKPTYWKGFGNLQVQAFFPIEFQKWFHGVSFRLFSAKTKTVLERLQEAKKTSDIQITWLPKEVYMQVVWVVFGENVLIIIYEPDIIVLRIKSSQVVKTFSDQLDYLWKKYNPQTLIR